MEVVHCRDCVYMKREPWGLSCKRYPPEVYYDAAENDAYSISPIVKSSDWCGEAYPKNATSNKKENLN